MLLSGEALRPVGEGDAVRGHVVALDADERAVAAVLVLEVVEAFVCGVAVPLELFLQLVDELVLGGSLGR